MKRGEVVALLVAVVTFGAALGIIWPLLKEPSGADRRGSGRGVPAGF